MGKKAYFIASKTPPRDYATCDKCGLLICEIQDGMGYWNPSPRARHRNICSNCYDVWKHDRDEGYQRWRDKHEALQHAIEPPPDATTKHIV